jgi:S1-C subfamily serine protease
VKIVNIPGDHGGICSMTRHRPVFQHFILSVCIILAVLGLSSCLLFEGSTRPPAQESGGLEELNKLQGAFRIIARDAVPVVVSITVHDIGGGNPWDFFFQDPDQDESAPRKKDYERSGMGSGIIVQKDDRHYYIITNYHVIRGGKNMLVILSDGREYPATVVGYDERKDIALLSIETTETQRGRLGNRRG